MKFSISKGKAENSTDIYPAEFSIITFNAIKICVIFSHIRDNISNMNVD